RLVAPVSEVSDPVLARAGATPAGAGRRRALQWTLAAALVPAAAWLLLALSGGEDRPGQDQASTRAGGERGWVADDIARARPFRSGKEWARQPRYSRDGRWLVYVVGSTDFREAWLEWSAADGSAPRRLETGEGLP